MIGRDVGATAGTPRRAVALTYGAGVLLVPHMAVLSGRYRRNSRDAIAECFDAGVARIELDVHSLDGGDYIVFHDRRLEAETTGSGGLGAATPDVIRGLRWRDDPGGRPPLLSEVVAMASACDTELQLDWKDVRLVSDDRVRTLLDLIAPVRDRVVVSTGQDWNLRRLHRAGPEQAFGFDPGLYLDRAIEETDIALPRRMGAYGYRDDHPLALARGQSVADYLEARFEMLALQAPGAREFFLSYRLVLQMLGDGFDAVAWLHAHDIAANVWTLDVGAPASTGAMRGLALAGADRVATNTAPRWIEAFAAAR